MRSKPDWRHHLEQEVSGREVVVMSMLQGRCPSCSRANTVQETPQLTRAGRCFRAAFSATWRAGTLTAG